jgi:hypothetical protein
MNRQGASLVELESHDSTEAAAGRYSKVFYPALCCIAVLMCVLLAWPFANSAFNDDWSYAHVALLFAQTGRITYNGWGGATILPQTLWGAAWIRLFGFSFNLLRLATLPFSVGFVLLVYGIGLEAGLRRPVALFAALTVGTSPLFIPFAASYMTEPYACLFTALCVYAAIASAQARDGDPRSIYWLWTLAASGILGGSDRQVVWAAPLVLVPYLFWLKRTDRRFKLHASAAYAGCWLSLIFVLRMLPQPYAPLELPRQQLMRLVWQNSVPAGFILLACLLSCLFLCLPAFIHVGTYIHVTARSIYWFCSAAVLFTGFLSMCLGSRYGLVPFLGNTVSLSGILDEGQDAMGSRPAILPLCLRLGLTFLLFFLVTACGWIYSRRRRHPASIPTVVFWIVSCAYMVLLLPGALLGMTFDRYLLPLFPLVVISILLLVPQKKAIPFGAWASLAVFAGYATATTHDYFNGLRARGTAADALRSRGVRPDHISAGFEYDGWLQLQVAGSVRPVQYGDNLSVRPGGFWFWQETTALTPEYVVSSWPVNTMPVSRMVTVPFLAWLPPFHRAAVVLKRADITADHARRDSASQTQEVAGCNCKVTLQERYVSARKGYHISSHI